MDFSFSKWILVLPTSTSILLALPLYCTVCYTVCYQTNTLTHTSDWMKMSIIFLFFPTQPVPECEVCEFMIQSVADQVESFGKDKIVEVFERICGLMPEQEQQFVSYCICNR